MASETVTCPCGETTVEFKGEPAFCGFCHCGDCRVAGCQAVHWGVVFPGDNVTCTKGALMECKTRETRTDFSCNKCGKWFFNTNKFGMKATSAMNFAGADQKPKDRFKPNLHIMYGERVIDVDDALPKFMDFPAAFGGSDKMYTKE